MKAELIFYRKNIEPNGDIVEIRIWKVSHSKRAPSGVKYSLVYIREGKRIRYLWNFYKSNAAPLAKSPLAPVIQLSLFKLLFWIVKVVDMSKML